MSTARTVLHLMHDLEVGGAQRAVVDLAGGLKAQGRYRPIVCARRRDGAMRDRCEEQGVQAVVLRFTRRSAWIAPLFLRDMLRGFAALERLARREDVTLVHAHMSDSAFWGVALARRLGCPVVVTIHSNNLVPYQLRERVVYRRVWRAVVRWTLARTDRVIAVSPAVGRMVCGEGGASRDRLTIVTNGIAPAHAAGPCTAARLRREFGLQDEARIVISVGRLVPNKRQTDLIDMMPDLIRREPRAVLLLVGSGPDERALTEKARSLGLARVVLLTGDRADVADLLHASSVYVSASLFEGVSLAILEAMAAGLPVIAFGAPGITDMLTEGGGIIIERRSASAMAEAVARVLADPAERLRLGARARSRIAEAFSLERVITEVSAVYDGLLDGGRSWGR